MGVVVWGPISAPARPTGRAQTVEHPYAIKHARYFYVFSFYFHFHFSLYFYVLLLFINFYSSMLVSDDTVLSKIFNPLFFFKCHFIV